MDFMLIDKKTEVDYYTFQYSVDSPRVQSNVFISA